MPKRLRLNTWGITPTSLYPDFQDALDYFRDRIDSRAKNFFVKIAHAVVPESGSLALLRIY